MVAVNNLRESLLQGLRQRSDLAQNAPGLAILQNARATEDGIRPYPTVTTETNIDALAASWPFPQLFRFMDKTILMKNASSPPQLVDETVDPWTFAAMTITDKHGNGVGPLPFGIFQVASFGAFLVFTNGGNVFYNKFGASTLQIATTQIASICNYKNSQLVMAGLGPSNLWPDVLKNFIKYRQAFDPDYPLPGGELATELTDSMEKWVWWCSVGGGDALMFMDPHALLLPPYSDITLEDEHLINGDFGSGETGWALGEGWTLNAGKIVASGATGNLAIDPASGYDIDAENQKYYVLTFDWKSTSGSCYVKAEDWESENLPASAALTTISIPIYFSGDPDAVTAPTFTFVSNDPGFTGEIDNISLKELVKHKQNYSPNMPSLLAYGDMKDVAKALIETAWDVADGVSSFSAVPRNSRVTNGNMYAAGDADTDASRVWKMWLTSTWLRRQVTADDYLTHGNVHSAGGALPVKQYDTFNFGNYDDDEVYDFEVYVDSRTAGSFILQFGTGSGYDSRKNVSSAQTANGWFKIVGMQTDTDPSNGEGNTVSIIPTDDYDGAIYYMHAEAHEHAIEDAYALESVTNHTSLKQLQAAMNTSMVAGDRYRIKWKQMSYVPANIIHYGDPYCHWNQTAVDLTSRPVAGRGMWSAEDDTCRWFGTSRLNLLSNHMFYLSQTFGWTLQANWAYDAGNEEMDHTAGVQDYISQSSSRMWHTPVHGREYQLIVRIKNMTAGGVSFQFGQNDVGDNTALALANGWFKATINANNTATDWTTFYIVSTSAFDGSIAEVWCLDLTQDADDAVGVWEVYGPQTTPLAQDETFMHCYPLIPGESYELQWTYHNNLDANTITPSLGDLSGTGKSSPGTYTETLVCGTENTSLSFEASATGSVQIYVDYLKPLFQQGVRPRIGNQTTPWPIATATYFANSADGIWESFSRIIRLPDETPNFDLEFQFQRAIFPVRIAEVELEPMDSQTAIIDMQPKPIIMDYFERNEAGFAPIPFPGQPLKVIQLGEHIMVYGTNNVCYLTTHTDPIHAKVARELDRYPRTLGVAGEGACAGDINEHIFVDEKGMLWHVAKGAVPIVTRLDYQEFFLPMLGNDIVITYDQSTLAWHIADGAVGYYWRDGRLSEAPYALSFLEFESGGLVGHKTNYAQGDPELIVLTNPISDGDPMVTAEMYQVKLIGRSQAGAYALGPEEITNGDFITDLSGWTIASDDWSWNAGGYSECDANASADKLIQDNFVPVALQEYQTRMTVVGTPASGGIAIIIGNAGGTTHTSEGTYIEIITASAATHFRLDPQTIPISDFLIDNVSCRQYRTTTSAFPIGLPFAVYVDAKLHDTDAWTRFGPFWPDARGIVKPKVSGVEFRIMVGSGNADLVELDDIQYVIRNEGKRSIGGWKSAVKA